jgi:hypothetical protein
MTAAPDADELAVKARLIKLLDGPDPDAQPDAVTAAAAAATAQPTPVSAADSDDDQDKPDAATAAQPDAPRRSRIPDWWTGRHVDLSTHDEPDAQPDADAQPDDVADDYPALYPNTTASEAEADAEAAGEEGEPDAVADAQPKKRPRLRIPPTPHIRSRAGGSAAAPGSLVATPAPRMSLLEAVQNVPPRFRWLILHSSAAAAGYRFGWVQYFTRYSDWLAHHGWLNVTGGFWVGCVVGGELLRRQGRGKALVIRWAFAFPMSSLVVGTLFYGTGWQNLELPL